MAAGEPMTKSPDWANLHEELLAVIAKKLTNAIHFVRFRAVCRRWRSAARPADLPPQTPWILLANLKEGGNNATSFFCPLSKERFSLNLPSTIPAMSVRGSSHGWIVLYDYEEKEETKHLSLLNPLTASRIHLPPLEVGRFPLINASLLSDPAAGGGRRCIVMVTVRCSSKFVFCRPGDASWTRVNMGLRMQYPVPAYHKGSFYIMDSYGNANGRTAICGPSLADVVTLIPAVDGSFSECHMAESDDGEQLFLVTTHSLRGLLRRDWKTEVFELDESAARPVWSKIDGIGGTTMFLGHIPSGMSVGCCCVKPSEFSRCRKNTLYFAHNHAGNIYLNVLGVGAPDLGDGDFEICRRYPNSPMASQPQGFWYTPIIQ